MRMGLIPTFSSLLRMALRRTQGRFLTGCTQVYLGVKAASRVLQEHPRPHPGANRHSQSLSGELVQNGQHFVATSIAEFIMNEVDGPDVVRMRRSQTDDRTVLVIEPPTLLVPLWEL